MEEIKADLVIHPVRLRILRSLTTGPKTTQEIAVQMPDVPKSSLYRHLKLLLEGQMIAVIETRLVQGIQEKIYRLMQPARLTAKDFENATKEDHFRYFTIYVVTLLQDFANYLASGAEIDLLADRTGYTEVEFWATDAELDGITKSINVAIFPLLTQPKSEGSRMRKLATILHLLDDHASR